MRPDETALTYEVEAAFEAANPTRALTLAEARDWLEELGRAEDLDTPNLEKARLGRLTHAVALPTNGACSWPMLHPHNTRCCTNWRIFRVRTADTVVNSERNSCGSCADTFHSTTQPIFMRDSLQQNCRSSPSAQLARDHSSK